MSQSRLMAEFEAMAKNPPPMTSAGPVKGNLHLWHGKIFGPVMTPYEGGVFDLVIDFPRDFPLRPPLVRFTTPIYHANISDLNGWVCLDILQKKWNPTISVSQILLALLNLMSNPNPEDPVNPQIGRLLMEQKHLYNRKAREETGKHAMKK